MQRDYIRFIVEGEVLLKPEDGTSRSTKASLADISFSGISVHSTEKIEIDIIVNFELATKVFGELVVGQGKTRYIREEFLQGNKIFKIGIKFTNIDSGIIQSILNRLQLDQITKMKKRTG
jgi:hypothetical protein